MPAVRNRPPAEAGGRKARRCRAIVAVEVHRCRCLAGRRQRAAALAELLRRLRRIRGCPGRLLRLVAELVDAESYRGPAD